MQRTRGDSSTPSDLHAELLKLEAHVEAAGPDTPRAALSSLRLLTGHFLALHDRAIHDMYLESIQASFA